TCPTAMAATLCWRLTTGPGVTVFLCGNWRQRPSKSLSGRYVGWCGWRSAPARSSVSWPTPKRTPVGGATAFGAGSRMAVGLDPVTRTRIASKAACWNLPAIRESSNCH
uniref:Copper-containing nitrite reductase n=1 Tax=Macrostomum lignano TaxID=282301 RepID=A0A1I8J3W3_9PLAT